MMYFKFLARGAIAPITGFAWRPGAWVEVAGALSACERGIHVLRAPDLAHWLHEELWKVEIAGARIEGVDCIVAQRARLVEPVASWITSHGPRFAQACYDCVAEHVARASTDEERGMLSHYLRGIVRLIAQGNEVAMASYVAAMAVSKVADEGTVRDRFRRERVRQSTWIARELALV